MEKPILVERFADNGEHSHWELLEPSDCAILWSNEKDEEDEDDTTQWTERITGDLNNDR